MAFNSILGRHPELVGKYNILGSYRLAVSTGAVTTIAARTATAGQLLVLRNPSTTHTVFLKRVAARFILTTAYTAAQETGCDLILARSFTASATAGTAVDVGSTVANTGNLLAAQGTSKITANCVRVADASAITAGTHTLDANPVGILTGWSGAVGDMVPEGVSGEFGVLWDARESCHEAPIALVADEGFVVRNVTLMGAAGVGRWDFIVEWDEGIPA